MACDSTPFNVVLTGFMGTGKTTVGRLLAVALDHVFVDTDAVLEERHGPIPDIFETLGEAGFRSLESELAQELAHRLGLVVSTGGGLMLDPSNATVLSASGRVFCLSADVDEIIRRVTASGDADSRPLLRGPNPERRISALLDDRRAQYAQFEQIPTSGHSPADVVATILARLREG